jgi:hypothetical protein
MLGVLDQAWMKEFEGVGAAKLDVFGLKDPSDFAFVDESVEAVCAFEDGAFLWDVGMMGIAQVIP